MMLGFEEGYKHFAEMAGSIFSSMKTEEHIQENMQEVDAHNAFATKYNKEIEDFIEELEKYNGFKTSVKQLKGNVAEDVLSRTFNLDAITKGSSSYTEVPHSTGFATPDITSNYGVEYGLKFDANGTISAREQAKSFFERYKEYKPKGEKESFQEYLKNRSIEDDSVMHDPIYMGQVRVIPRDQMEEATRWLQQQIAKESVDRPELVKKYKDTLDMLNDKLSDGKGVESISLSEKEAREIARLARDGNQEEVLKKLGIEREQFQEYEAVLKAAMKAGITAGVITMVLKTAPELLKVIDYLIREGEIDKEQLKKTGKVAFTSYGEGFVKGFFSGLLVSLCKKGVFGQALKRISPPIIGTVVYLLFNVVINASKVARKKMTRRELANELVKDMYIATISIAGGFVGQATIHIPVFGFLIGSLVGTAIGSVTYAIEDKAIMSYCVDSGFTMFGLVEQDYRLPEDIVEEIGLEVFDYETFDFETFETESFEFESFDVDTFETDNIGIKVLRRGVIEVHKIGYV